MKRRDYQIVVALSLLLLILCAIPALSSTIFSNSNQVQAKDIGARAEATEWKYAPIDGVLHKRLWSITYDRWLTDWIPC